MNILNSWDNEHFVINCRTLEGLDLVLKTMNCTLLLPSPETDLTYKPFVTSHVLKPHSLLLHNNLLFLNIRAFRYYRPNYVDH